MRCLPLKEALVVKPDLEENPGQHHCHLVQQTRRGPRRWLQLSVWSRVPPRTQSFSAETPWATDWQTWRHHIWCPSQRGVVPAHTTPSISAPPAPHQFPTPQSSAQHPCLTQLSQDNLYFCISLGFSYGFFLDFIFIRFLRILIGYCSVSGGSRGFP